jgi:hypothetical protein
MFRNRYTWMAFALLGLMLVLAGGAALRESPAVDEISHVGAGLSYWQRLDLRLNPEHPPLAKALAGLPLALRGTNADYSSSAWQISRDFFSAYAAQWVFGDAVLGRWNPWQPTLLWARFPMLVLTLFLGWVVYRYATRLGGAPGGLLCLAAYVTAPSFLAFGPLVLTDLPATLFVLIALWQLGNIWAAPSARNAALLGIASAAAMLTKFTGLLLIPVTLLLFVQTRWWPSRAEPAELEERKQWRKARWQCAFRALFWTAAIVYVVYFILSWNQPDDVLNRVGSGSWASLIRRPLMPPWLYLRGLLLMLLTASRPTYLFGHSYSHGVPFYFPVVFALKSTLGFLLLLVVSAAAAVAGRNAKEDFIPAAVRPHWRVLMVGFFTFFAACLLSQLDISIRHFMVPIVLLILMLAPVPRFLSIGTASRRWLPLIPVLAFSSLVSVLAAYPYFFPFTNGLAFGRPPYYLLNDSNVSWNEGLPAVGRFAREQHLDEIALDWASLSDAALVVPQARMWNCQTPADRDAGQWVAVAAISILENRNCGYLVSYPKRELAGGSFYLFRLPSPIPPAGAPGGSPLPSSRKNLWGIPFDVRDWSVQVERHPDSLYGEMQNLKQKLQEEDRKRQSAGKPAR